MKQECPKCGERVEDDITACPRCRHIILREDESAAEEFSEQILSEGTILADEYKVVRLLGRGGAGCVYEARQISLQNMRVALKVLHPDIDQNETSIALLKKEVIISRELTHENIIKVYSLDKFQSRHFLVMEYVDGRHLGHILRELGKLNFRQLGPIFLQVCDALEYAHGRGVIHLDIKPGNILLGTSGNVKLCDFGIARMVLGNVTTATQRLVAGSLGYMPPEQFSGRKFLTNQSDIYALGATIYHVLTGHVPAGSYDRSNVPQSVLQAMAPNPGDRFESVKDFRRAFIRETSIGPIDPEEVRTLVASTSEPIRSFQGPGHAAVRLPSDSLIIEDDLSYGSLTASPESSLSVPVTSNTDSWEATVPLERPSQYAQTAALTRASSRLSTKDGETGAIAGARKTQGTKVPDRLRASAVAEEAATERQAAIRQATRKSRRNVILGVGTALAVVIVLIAVAAALKKYRTVRASAPNKVQTAKYDWYDAQRNREVPVRVYFPAGEHGALPAIIFSHAVGGSRDSAEYLGKYWAAHGYVSAHIQHRGSDAQGKKEGFPLGAAVRETVQRLSHIVERTRDAHFAVDQLERVNRDDKTLRGSIDLGRIGMAGHSLGAFTTLAVVGATITFPQGREESFVDHRIKAALLVNSIASPRQKPILNRMLSGVKIPCMHITGSPERGPGVGVTPDDRRLMFDNIRGSDQYLIVFGVADHDVLPHQPSTGEQEANASAIHDLICISSTAFWDAYLKADAKAGAWLTDGGLEAKLGNLGTVQKKLVK
ncbi:MAG: protein kinase [Desulfomonile tiedjei]|uniref:Protein kinase n=1 Tax=Desulfomonile tiedjei TaxID=2358 RepID=A0A9D6V1T6_9BACT|nr:protein kinase [Desulfomonile tiedjei]